MCSEARRKFGEGYHIRGPSREGLWRGTIHSLLPYADRPKLVGPTEESPYVTVVEHDMELSPKIMAKVSCSIRDLSLGRRIFEA